MRAEFSDGGRLPQQRSVVVAPPDWSTEGDFLERRASDRQALSERLWEVCQPHMLRMVKACRELMEQEIEREAQARVELLLRQAGEACIGSSTSNFQKLGSPGEYTRQSYGHLPSMTGVGSFVSNRSTDVSFNQTQRSEPRSEQARRSGASFADSVKRTSSESMRRQLSSTSFADYVRRTSADVMAQSFSNAVFAESALPATSVEALRRASGQSYASDMSHPWPDYWSAAEHQASEVQQLSFSSDPISFGISHQEPMPMRTHSHRELGPRHPHVELDQSWTMVPLGPPPMPSWLLRPAAHRETLQREQHDGESKADTECISNSGNIISDASADAAKCVMVCRHWKSKGFCRLEQKCKFLHLQHKRGNAKGKGKTTPASPPNAPWIDGQTLFNTVAM